MKIRLENISCSYNDKTEVLDNFNLTIEPNSVVAVIGHNGSGKSTLAKVMLGLLPVDKGNLYLDDTLVTEDNIDDYRLRMGIIFQNPDNQFVGSTVKDDVAFGLENRCIPYKEMNETIDKYLHMVGMEEFINNNPEQLSGGQKQRVAVADILACDPEVIVFDEATSMLDPVCTKDVISLIKDVAASGNKTIIIITHNLEEALLANRVIVLNKGKIVKDGTPEEVFKETAILEASGLRNVPSIELLNKLKKMNYPKKELIEKTLWESTFKN